jgi:hypothetical protein
MSIQALAWAIEQRLPGPAKLVLLALSNHADHTDGHCHFEPPTIAHEASVQERSLPRYLGALERNGYLAKTGDSDKREYWLQMDRDPSLEWAWSASDISGDVEAVSDSSYTAAERVARGLALAPPETPIGFSRARQAEKVKAASPPKPSTTNQFPVIEGSRAYLAWCDHLRERKQIIPYVRNIILSDGTERRGFYMPTAFPVAEQKIEPIE